MKNIINYKKGKFSYILWIMKRILNNLNFIALAKGPTGIGKSLMLIAVARSIDPDFSVNQIAFTFKEVMQIINSDWFKKKKWKIIIFDEAQTSVNSRTWQSLINRLFNYLMSTFRHQNIIFLMSSPYQDFIDSATMKLVHCIFDVKGHSEKTQRTLVRARLLQYNSEMKKFYYHSLMVMRDGMLHKCKSFNILRPPKKIELEYEAKKKLFTDELNRKIMFELDQIDRKDEKRNQLTELQQEVKDLLDSGLKQKDICIKLQKKSGEISKCVKSIRNKGFLLRKGEKLSKLLIEPTSELKLL